MFFRRNYIHSIVIFSSIEIDDMNTPNFRPFSLSLSAPGKIILFGEYSVVFEKPALSSTLCLRTKLNFTESSENVVHIKFSALNLEKSFNLIDIKNYIKANPNENWEKYLIQMNDEFEQLYKETYKKFDLSDSQKNSLIAFFHCFRNCITLSRGFHFEVVSNLPVGSGVGSSASFSVVLAASLLLYKYHLSQTKSIDEMVQRSKEGNLIAGEELKNLISELAFSCEKIFHGSPSGVDNTTVLYGSMLKFIKLAEGNNVMESIVTRPIRILLVNTNVPRSTKTLLQYVRQLKQNHPDVVENVFKAIESVTLEAVSALKNDNSCEQINTFNSYFGELISLNHNLLRVIGVSHPTLEHIVAIANKYNLSAKLTGGGGGGFAFIYLPDNFEVSKINKVTKELSTAGFTVTEVNLGGPGLIIEDLVMCQN